MATFAFEFSAIQTVDPVVLLIKYVQGLPKVRQNSFVKLGFLLNQFGTLVPHLRLKITI